MVLAMTELPQTRPPSGLFPAGPARPRYREPHPVRAAAVTAGLGFGVLWLLFFALLATSVRAYGWLTIIAGLVAWAAAFVLARVGDRGVAVGVAMATAVAWAVAALVVVAAWSTSGWPLW